MPKKKKPRQVKIRQDAAPDTRQQLKERKAKVVEHTNEVAFWENRIQFAESYQAPYYASYQTSLNYYGGDQWDEHERLEAESEKQHLLTINRVLPTIATQNAQIVWRIPWWRVIQRLPSGGGDPQAAALADARRRTAEGTLNYVMQHPRNDVLTNARLATLGGHFGIGALKVTFTPDEGWEPEEDEEVWGQVIQEEGPDGLPITDVMGGIPWTDPKTGEMKRKRDMLLIDTRNIADQYRLDWTDWRDLVFDPEGGNVFMNHGWMAHRMVWNYDKFMKNPMFTNTEGVKDISREVSEDGLRKPQRFNAGSRITAIEMAAMESQERDVLRVPGWQIWDFEKRQNIYVVEGHDKIVAKERFPRWIDHDPYSFVKFHEMLSEWYPYTEFEASRPLIRSYNKLRSQVMNHRRRFNRKYSVVKDDVLMEELEKLKDPADGTIVFVAQQGAIDPIQDAPLDQALYRNMELDVRDMSEIHGVTPEARGSPQGETATQAAILEKRGSSREADKRRIVGRALAQSGKKMLDALQANLDKHMAVRIVGPNGEVFEKMTTRVDLTGDFETKIEVSELEPNDFATEQSRLLRFAQIMGPLAFRSKRWVTRITENLNVDDPELVQEIVALHEAAATEELQKQTQAAGGPPQGEGQGGPTAPGREAGRNLRSVGGPS